MKSEVGGKHYPDEMVSRKTAAATLRGLAESLEDPSAEVNIEQFKVNASHTVVAESSDGKSVSRIDSDILINFNIKQMKKTF